MSVLKNSNLCKSKISNVCDEEGIGNSLLWSRFEQLRTIVDNNLDEQYRDFFAQPQKINDLGDDYLEWYTPVGWPDIRLRQLTVLEGEERLKYDEIKTKTIAAYKDAIARCDKKGRTTDAEYLTKAMKHVGERDELFFCGLDKVVVTLWGMKPKTTVPLNEVVFVKQIYQPKSFTVKFELTELGRSTSPLILHKLDTDKPIQQDQIPQVTPREGWNFTGWNNDPLNHKVIGDITFTAQYEKTQTKKPNPVDIFPPKPQQHKVRFFDREGNIIVDTMVEHGTVIPVGIIPQIVNIEGVLFKGWDKPVNAPILDDMDIHPLFDAVVEPSIFHRVRFFDKDNNVVSELQVEHSSIIPSGSIPELGKNKHSQFIGWDKPTDAPIECDTDFYPEYNEKLPWWKKIDYKKWLKWLLRILLMLLLLLLLWWLLRQCKREPTPVLPPPPSPILVRPEPVPTPGEDDIIDNPDPLNPGKIIDNLLGVILDDDNLTVENFERDFKRAYPDDKYKVVYRDNDLKRIEIQVPQEERVKIKQELVSKLPAEYQGMNSNGETKVYIIDEFILDMESVPNDARLSKCWYHKAIKSYGAWNTSMGSEDIVVAVIDDGFNIRHEELAGKIVSPYNVLNKTSMVGEISGHGTHVAGLIAATANNSVGISGVAPKCKIMPIKVFVNGPTGPQASTLAITDGLLYAIKKNVNVVNMSLGYNFDGMPMEKQMSLIRNGFKEQERLWKKIFSMANAKNIAIVVSAGNSNVLAAIDPKHRSEHACVVAAVDNNNNPQWTKASFSNYGDAVNISAPGVSILSTVGQNNYEFMDGTSQASPIVAGAVALMKSICPNMPNKEILKILQETGLPVRGSVANMIQLDKAVMKIKQKCGGIDDEKPIPSTGDVQILLEWHNTNDLDVMCKDPAGDVIYYGNKVVPSGGKLEIDMNAGGNISHSPIENIYWPRGGAPKGQYIVYVKYFSHKNNEPLSTDYKVTVRYGGHEKVYNLTTNVEKQVVKICEFTLE